jgi:predicted lipid-binding transport protein (Tim44 family)
MGREFPIDLVLFGMIAVFLVLRLRSILGKRTGYERPPQPYQPPQPPVPPQPGAVRPAVVGAAPEAEGRSEPASAQASRAAPDPASPAGQALARMQKLDPSLDAARFLDGAEQAFRMIVGAFAAGDRATLRSLLSDDTYRAFESAIAARETAGETQKTEIRAINAATMEAASVLNTIGSITVRFVSDQVSVTFGKSGQPVSGTESVTEITDLWTFERDLSSHDPTWRLVAARSA